MFKIGLTVRKATRWDCHKPISLAAWRRRHPKSDPPRALWVAVATEEAADAGLDPEDILEGYKGHKACRARWRAWRRIVDMPEGYSFSGLARTSGWSSGDICYGLKRLEKPEIKIWRDREASSPSAR